MSNLLQFIAIASVVGTVIFIILALIKPVTWRMFSRAWHYYMGLIPLFFYLGGVRLINMLIWQHPSGIYTATPAGLYENLSTIPDTYVNISASSGLNNIFYMQVSPYHFLSLPEQSFIHSLQSGVSWLFEGLRFEFTPRLAIFLSITWALGAILFVAVNTWRYLIYRQNLLRHSRSCSSVEGPVRIAISKKATTPMAIGFIKPLIILPDIVISNCELDMILAHELAHFKRKDVWLKLVILATRAIHWFNPVVHFLSRYMHDLCERSCDEKVVIKMGIRERKLYGETILSMLQQAQVSLICASGLCNSQKNVKRRLTDMLNVKKMRKVMVALSVVLTLVIVGIGGIVAHGFRVDYDADVYYEAAEDDIYFLDNPEDYTNAEDSVAYTIGEPESYEIDETSTPESTSVPRVQRQEFLDYRSYYDNDDIIGQVRIPNTTIDYLVVQGTDNHFYLDHCLQGRRYLPGTIFLDYQADIHNLGDQNWVLFGHNMGRNHKFHALRFFLDEDFFHNNRYILFSTIYAEYIFEVFSAYVTHIDFPYINTRYEDWGHWVNQFANRSLHDAGISVSAEDRILTLSTCDNNQRDYRIAVHAVLRSVTFPHLD